MTANHWLLLPCDTLTLPVTHCPMITGHTWRTLERGVTTDTGAGCDSGDGDMISITGGQYQSSGVRSCMMRAGDQVLLWIITLVTDEQSCTMISLTSCSHLDTLHCQTCVHTPPTSSSSQQFSSFWIIKYEITSALSKEFVETTNVKSNPISFSLSLFEIWILCG